MRLEQEPFRHLIESFLFHTCLNVSKLFLETKACPRAFELSSLSCLLSSLSCFERSINLFNSSEGDRASICWKEFLLELKGSMQHLILVLGRIISRTTYQVAMDFTQRKL